MHGLFNYDGFFVQTMNKIADCICLSILWLVSSIPVFTVGAATTALYYAMNKCIRHGVGGVWRTYWQGFRTNFRQATGLWLILLLIFILMTACCYSAWLMCVSGNLPGIMFWVSLFVAAIVLHWSSFLFPYLAKFRNTNRIILKNCIYIAIMNFPAGLLNLVLMALALLAVTFFPLALVCVPGLYMVLSCFSLEPVFRKYMSEEDRAKEDALLQDAD